MQTGASGVELLDMDALSSLLAVAHGGAPEAEAYSSIAATSKTWASGMSGLDILSLPALRLLGGIRHGHRTLSNKLRLELLQPCSL